ncbi:hemin ABC transporter substrate-binding protein [Aquipseudomonas alcaligenes]|uniref:Hemin ABC transporter substrate-binding protein n=1 Tax=Aquipseudomonas alcaligenes TaxID=43263 RepID=A0A2V4L927_AQUAC|nr:ABC transporter substrate-binding protein [Pseudomonas alcaligenes]PYC28258.1 hemin ABC transporter substrate-binding protein [Pseudomonas alcaligenes]
MRLANCVLLCSSLLFSHAAAAAELPQRWVSSGGSLSEWVVRLGGEGRLVGVDTTSLHPQSLRQLPSVGYQRALSAEGVLSLRPDILIGSEEMGPPPVVAQIAAAGVRVESLSAKPDLANLERNVLRLGELLGVPAQAREQMAAYRQQLQDQAQWVAEARRRQAPPRVVMLLGHAGSNLMAAGQGSLAVWLIEQAGGESPVAHQGYKALSNEALLALDPQVLIFADRSLHGEEARQALLKHNPLLQQTSAVRDGRLQALDPTLLVGGLGPRLPEGLAELSAAFYPSAQALTAELDR